MLQHPKHGMIMTVNLQLQVEYSFRYRNCYATTNATTGAESMAGETFTNGVTIPQAEH